MRRALLLLEQRLSRLSLITSGVILVVMVALIFIEVIGRYVFSYSFGVADEFGAYLLVAVIFLGLTHVAKTDAHIRVQVLVSRLPARTNDRLRVITLVFFLVFSVVCTILAYDFVVYNYIRDVRSFLTMRTPQWIPMAGMAVGFAMLSLALVLRLVLTSIAKSRGGNP
jgi:TRAP-type C4-dicarboxylate transport system permease small subunit